MQEVRKIKQSMVPKFADCVYNGFNVYNGCYQFKSTNSNSTF